MLLSRRLARLRPRAVFGQSGVRSHSTTAAATGSASQGAAEDDASEAASSGVRRSGRRRVADDGRSLRDFLPRSSNSGFDSTPVRPALSQAEEDSQPVPLRYHIKNYGCAMNHSDSEIVETLLREAGMSKVERPEEAEVLLLNTCAIRHNVENKVWSRLGHYRDLRNHRQSWHEKRAQQLERQQELEQQQQQQPVEDAADSAPAAASAASAEAGEAAADPDEDPDDVALASAAAAGRAGIHRDSKPPPKQTVVGVLGCMAERVKEEFFQKAAVVDVVAGPDAYRDLPNLLAQAAYGGQPAINVQLSLEETYADVLPTVRTTGNSVSAFVSIMRGCDNMCAFCVVPQTRGRERSRDVDSILREVRWLSRNGFKEVTLLGQNVNSYNDTSPSAIKRMALEAGAADAADSADAVIGDGLRKVPLRPTKDALTPGFKNISRRREQVIGFAKLLELVSAVDPNMRIRYTSPHPKDFPTELLRLIRQRPNICRQVHFPAQSGNTEVLKRMRRGYDRETYLELAKRLRDEIPGVALSTDMISGFCGETEAEHQDTLTLMDQVAYEQAFMFRYSERPRTWAHRRLADDVPEPVKTRRLNEVMAMFESAGQREAQRCRERVECVLVDGNWRRDERWWSGRADSNRRVLFPPPGLPAKPLWTSPSAAAAAAAAEDSAAAPSAPAADAADWVQPEVPLVLDDIITDDSGELLPYQRLRLSPASAGRPVQLGDYVAVRITEPSPFMFRGELLGILPGGLKQFATLDPNREYHLHLEADRLGLSLAENPYYSAEVQNLLPGDLEADEGEVKAELRRAAEAAEQQLAAASHV